MIDPRYTVHQYSWFLRQIVDRWAPDLSQSVVMRGIRDTVESPEQVWSDINAMMLSHPFVRIAVERRAYELWQSRGCLPHTELTNWLDAENEVIVQSIKTVLDGEARRDFESNLHTFLGS